MVRSANDAYFPMGSTPEFDSVVDRLDAVYAAVFSEDFNAISNKEMLAFTEDQLRILENDRENPLTPADSHPRLDQTIALFKKLILNMADLIDLD